MSQEKLTNRNNNRMYVSCPICSTTLLQGELVKNTIVKCEGCHQRIVVEIEDGKTSAKPFHTPTFDLEKNGS